MAADEFFALGVGGRRSWWRRTNFFLPASVGEDASIVAADGFFALGSRELGFSETAGPNGLFFRTYKN